MKHYIFTKSLQKFNITTGRFDEDFAEETYDNYLFFDEDTAKEIKDDLGNTNIKIEERK